MRQDATTEIAARRVPARTAPAAALRLLISAAIGALLIALAYQVPARHAVDVGGYDAAYTQGFYDTNRADAPDSPSYLQGSDGRARWTRASSFLLFPQIGLPAELSLRLRAAPGASANQHLAILLNGLVVLGEIAPTAEWQEYRYPINTGLTKLSDVVVELRSSELATLGDGDNREVGVLLDRASLETVRWPILPYPSQVAFGALFGALAWALFEGSGFWETRRQGDKETRRQSPDPSLQFLHPTSYIPMLALGGMALLFLVLYRLQPLYPYPLRLLLPGLDLVLLAAVALRYLPAVKRRTLLADSAAVVVGLVWLGAIALAAGRHSVLSVPGVEKDFHVFAGRSARLFGIFQPSGVYDSASDGVLRADGFYNLGYPFLLWLVRPFVFNNPFLAAQIVALASGTLLLLAAWWLARRLLGSNGALMALVCLTCSPIIAEYSLYLGSDMPFAAACMVALALLLGTGGRGQGTGDRQYAARNRIDNGQQTTDNGQGINWALIAAGCAAGVAFLFRHPGVVLLPFGWFALWFLAWRGKSLQQARGQILIFTAAWLVAALPQLMINLRDAGNPLYSQQAKNIWLAVYGNGDWANWTGAPNTIGLADVVLSDPVRFLNNWLVNLRGFLGAGGEDVSEFGRADQLRFLVFPANWFAIAALGFWAIRPSKPAFRLLAVWIAVYAVGIAVGLSNLRFVLPLVPVYAVAAAWSVLWLGRALARLLERRPEVAVRAPLLVGGVAAALIAGGLGVGAGYVLAQQPASELAAVQLIEQTVEPNQLVRLELDPRIQFDEYSAIAHLAAPVGQQPAFVLRPNGATAQAGEQFAGSAGGYSLYRTP